MISTMDSRDTRAFVGTKDIFMLHEMADHRVGGDYDAGPMQGFSAFDRKEGPLHDPGAPELFAASLKENLNDKSKLDLLPFHINDPDFGRAIIDTMKELTCNQM
jgi:uncharacterized protein (UPF0261 family)